MADNQKSALAQKFAEMPPKKRMMVAGGGIFLILAIATVAMSPDPKPIAKPDSKKTKEVSTNFSMAGGNKDLSFEKLAAQVEAGKMEIELEKSKSRQAISELKKAVATPDAGVAESLAELKKLKEEIEAVKAAAKKRPQLDDELPPGASMSSTGMRPIGTDSSADYEEKPEPPKLRVLGGSIVADADQVEKPATKPVVFLPSGSNFEGILLNGMDAPTSAVTVKNPVPALMRIKTDAILPNRHRYDMRECFIIVSGHGVLSTERAQLQLVSLSCVKTDGSVIEAKLSGYIVGEDGKVGMRGRLVTKQGQIIAKSMLAGFASGFGTAMAPTAVPQLNTTPGATQQYQVPDLGNAAMAGAAQGIASSAKAISDFYLSMAKEMFPIVEIDANRKATVILTKGVELNVNGAGSK